MLQLRRAAAMIREICRPGCLIPAIDSGKQALPFCSILSDVECCQAIRCAGRDGGAPLVRLLSYALGPGRPAGTQAETDGFVCVLPERQANLEGA